MLPLTDAEKAEAVRRLLVMARHCFRDIPETQARSRRYGISRSAFAGSLRNIPEPQGRSPPVGRDRLAVSRSKARALTSSNADRRPLVTSTGGSHRPCRRISKRRERKCVKTPNSSLGTGLGNARKVPSTGGEGDAGLDEERTTRKLVTVLRKSRLAAGYEARSSHDCDRAAVDAHDCIPFKGGWSGMTIE